ncbi:MAG TPA: hypothetical protein VFR37_13045 [Longimicrobium sp.]|nr:hypothetical protein [Longimicrobium sp.]
MTTTLYLTYDGEVFLPDQPVPLAPNTRVRVTIETEQDEQRPRKSFLDTAESLRLDGPTDWSTRVDAYLYGDRVPDGE